MDFDSILGRVLGEGVERYGIVGASAAVVRSEGTVWEHHCGLADRERGVGPDARTIWDWGSVTKLLCGICILQQRDRGWLRLDEAAVRWLAVLKEIVDPFGTRDAITLEHLLTHMSGLQSGSYPDPIELGTAWPLWGEVERGLPRIKAEARPGERYIYSNLGFMLLGRIVELATRDEWESYATKNILMPLDMREAYFDQTPYHLAERRAESYDEKGSSLGVDVDHGATTANGGLKACLRDMAQFARFLLRPEKSGVLARATLEEMMRPRHAINAESGVGLAFHTLKFPRQKLVGHNGAAAGFRAGVWCAPEAGAVLLVAANTASARALLAEMCRAFAEVV